jgi:hypothetical protein
VNDQRTPIDILYDKPIARPAINQIENFRDKLGGDIKASPVTPRAKRYSSVVCPSPVASANSQTNIRPKGLSTRRDLRVLRACTCRVAQRQLFGVYGPLLSMRSRLKPDW